MWTEGTERFFSRLRRRLLQEELEADVAAAAGASEVEDGVSTSDEVSSDELPEEESPEEEPLEESLDPLEESLEESLEPLELEPESLDPEPPDAVWVAMSNKAGPSSVHELPL